MQRITDMYRTLGQIQAHLAKSKCNKDLAGEVEDVLRWMEKNFMNDEVKSAMSDMIKALHGATKHPQGALDNRQARQDNFIDVVGANPENPIGQLEDDFRNALGVIATAQDINDVASSLINSQDGMDFALDMGAFVAGKVPGAAGAGLSPVLQAYADYYKAAQGAVGRMSFSSKYQTPLNEMLGELKVHPSHQNCRGIREAWDNFKGNRSFD